MRIKSQEVTEEIKTSHRTQTTQGKQIQFTELDKIIKSRIGKQEAFLINFEINFNSFQLDTSSRLSHTIQITSHQLQRISCTSNNPRDFVRKIYD